MLKNFSLKKFEIISTIFITIIGTLLHFTFEWSGNNSLVGIFSAVNESIWEHLKILFFPMLITSIIGYFLFRKEYSNYLCSKTKGLILAISFIVIFHYTYSGIIGSRFAIIDIISFIVAIIIGEIYTYKKVKSNTPCNNKISAITLAILTLSFIIFTFYPPHIGIFKDPQTETYGIQQ